VRLAADLAIAAVAAATHRIAVLEQERQALAKLQDELTQELADGEDETAFAAREAALRREIATLEAAVAQVQDEVRRRREQLHASFAQAATDLRERIARWDEETAETRLVARLLSALEAFGFEHREAVPAEIPAHLRKLVQQAGRTKSRLTEHCRQLAQRFAEEGDRIAAWRERMAEESTLRRREQELLAHLRLHGRDEGGIPPLVASLDGAHLRTLRLLRQRVLEPILSDLAAEDAYGLPTNGDDPLSELTARLRAVP
jgi:hypothetical protein